MGNLTAEVADHMTRLGAGPRSYFRKAWMRAVYLAVGVLLLLSSCRTFKGGDDRIVVGREETPELTLTQADKGKSFEIERSDLIIIGLKENPTTGYKWAVERADDRILGLQGSEFYLPEDSRVGEGGTRVFTFKAKAAGTSRIKLKHWREWEGSDSVIDRFDATIVVND